MCLVAENLNSERGFYMEGSAGARSGEQCQLPARVAESAQMR